MVTKYTEYSETHQKYIKITLNYHYLECWPKKIARIATKSEFTTKHRMFRGKNYASPEKIYTTAGCDGWDI